MYSCNVVFLKSRWKRFRRLHAKQFQRNIMIIIYCVCVCSRNEKWKPKNENVCFNSFAKKNKIKNVKPYTCQFARTETEFRQKVCTYTVLFFLTIIRRTCRFLDQSMCNFILIFIQIYIFFFNKINIHFSLVILSP